MFLGVKDEYEGECKRGSRWKKDECNWCACVNGKQSCTSEKCDKQGIIFQLDI